MAYSKASQEGHTFMGGLISNRLHREFSRLCALSGRSKAKEIETAISIRTTQLLQQEKQGTIRGVYPGTATSPKRTAE